MGMAVVTRTVVVGSAFTAVVVLVLCVYWQREKTHRAKKQQADPPGEGG